MMISSILDGCVPRMPWIPREGHNTVAQFLLRHKLVKTDQPLKKGGRTDVYLDIRNTRAVPGSSRKLAKLYARAIQQLGPIDLIVEVPFGISGVAEQLSHVLKIPYISIRDEAKEGRASDAVIVGECKRGQRVVIIDDVITNGASKMKPYRLCHEKGLVMIAIIVLVDRQQGWEAEFKALGIDIPIWAGMMLHDLRREYLELGYIAKCPVEVAEKNPIIVALDNKSWAECLSTLISLRPTGTIFKVNDLVFDEGMAHLLPELSVYGRVMLDLKLHEIPNTVANTCKRVAPHKPWAVTVHASGGAAMVKAARDNLPLETKVLAITVLTSIDKNTCEEVYHRFPIKKVKELAKTAMRGGADGLVCSGEEVAILRKMFPKAILVVPGSRSPDEPAGDQARVVTPRKAMDNGANYLVMGRQVMGKPDPAAEVRRVTVEELKRAA